MMQLQLTSIVLLESTTCYIHLFSILDYPTPNSFSYLETNPMYHFPFQLSFKIIFMLSLKKLYLHKDDATSKKQEYSIFEGELTKGITMKEQ